MTEKQSGSTTPKAQSIADEVRRRIVDMEWRQGDRIPDEAELATEFNAARATVNKALQRLADEGLLDRRRRAGTRVTIDPTHKVTFEIPIVREQIEREGLSYGYRVIAQKRSPLPKDLAKRLCLTEGQLLVRLRAVHYGNGRPFQLEDRWLNPDAVPELANVDFNHFNANEWLVRHAPYKHADFSFSAENASARDARLLQIRQGQALLILNRTTWNAIGPITSVRIAFQPGYLFGSTDTSSQQKA